MSDVRFKAVVQVVIGMAIVALTCDKACSQIESQNDRDRKEAKRLAEYQKYQQEDGESEQKTEEEDFSWQIELARQRAEQEARQIQARKIQEALQAQFFAQQEAARQQAEMAQQAMWQQQMQMQFMQQMQMQFMQQMIPGGTLQAPQRYPVHPVHPVHPVYVHPVYVHPVHPVQPVYVHPVYPAVAPKLQVLPPGRKR